MRRFAPHLAAAAIAALLPPLLGVDSCGADLLDDAGFDMWCGDSLCAWEIESGAVKKVPTWHEADAGAALVGEDVAISQANLDASSSTTGCITFSLLADADDGADLTLEMDFLDDGVVEWSAPIPATDWEQVSFHVTPPDWWQGVRFRIRKTGSARAVIAMVRAQSDGADSCSGPPLALGGRPEGAPCTQDADCGVACADTPVLWSDPSTGDVLTYTAETCGGCDADADCGTGEVCGLGWGEYGERECLPAAQKSLGDTCASDGECGTGICCDAQCAECCAGTAACGDGSACERHDVVDVDAPALEPWMCAPADRPVGSACLADADCAGNTCFGRDFRVCNPDGRPCGTDADCPDWTVYLGAVCTTVGVAAGTCR